MAAHQAPLSLGFSRQEYWSAISFSSAWRWKVKVKSLSRVRLLAIPWTAAYQAPPSMGFSRQEYWSEVPLPSPMYMLSCVQLFVTLESSSPGFSLHESIPGKNTGVGCMPSSRGSSQPKNQTQVCCVSRWILYPWSHQGSPWPSGISPLLFPYL